MESTKPKPKGAPISPGDRFTRLTAIEQAGMKGRNVLWRCVCDCGVETVRPAWHLRKDIARSCGCLKREKSRAALRKAPGHAGKQIVFGAYRKSASARGIDFALTFDDVVRLTSQDCFYCGTPPAAVTAQGKSPEQRKHAAYVHNGIDRVDSSAGYCIDNCVPCCSHCNYAKRDLSQDQFFQWLARTYRNVFGGGK